MTNNGNTRIIELGKPKKRIFRILIYDKGINDSGVHNTSNSITIYDYKDKLKIKNLKERILNLFRKKQKNPYGKKRGRPRKVE